jgi:DNA-binding transcriptional LysR family regulator
MERLYNLIVNTDEIRRLTVLDTRQLRYFVAVADDLHFTKAADRLHVAQSSLSTQVNQLEAQLGARLLARRKRSAVSLTDAGVLFLVEARRALEQVERAEAVGRRAGRGELGHIAIGYTPSAALSGALSSVIRTYRVQNSDVALHLAEMESPEQLAAIIEGRLDVGFIRSLKDYPDGVSASVIRQERLLLALPADHHLADKGEAVEVGVLSDETLIVPQFDEYEGFLYYVAEFVAAVRPTPEHVYPVRGIPTALSLVGAGVGVALVSESWRSLAMANVVYREIVDFERIVIVVLAHRTRERAPAVLAFVETCKGLRA